MYIQRPASPTFALPPPSFYVMIPAAKPANESERLSSLYEYEILDSIPESEYDDITKIAADICNMPISLISIIDADRQWFKSRVGLETQETHRDLAFCAHAILDPATMMEVPDANADERFTGNALVTGAPHIGFYAGVPLVNEDGNAMGTLCVIDNKPNQLTPEQKATLVALARQIVAYMEIRKKNLQFSRQKQELELLNQELDRFAYVVAHDIKSPCSSLMMATDLVREIYGSIPNEEGTVVLDMMEDCSKSIINLVDGILKHTLTVNKTDIAKESFRFGDFMEDVRKLLPQQDDLHFEYNNPDLTLYTSRFILMQIILNLCTNAIKYNDKPRIELTVSLQSSGSNYAFKVKDNGIGIPEKNLASIFDLFNTLGVKDRNNNKGFGIGLATVKRLVQKMGGDIQVTSEPGMGSTFAFNIVK